MMTLALFVRLEALPEKAQEAEALLKTALALANAETSTPVWFALKFSPTTFGVFDAFHDEAGRQAHLGGPIAQALMSHGRELFAWPLNIESVEVLGAKVTT